MLFLWTYARTYTKPQTENLVTGNEAHVPPKKERERERMSDIHIGRRVRDPILVNHEC